MDRKLYSYDLTFMLVASILAALHIYAWSDYPPGVDPINFTVALRNGFSPASDSPHPPGYPLYVFAARLAAFLAGERHAYQFINLGMLLGSGGILYWLFRRINATAIGFASAVLLMTHPLAWAATVIAECYVSDLFFGITIFAFVMTQRDSNRRLLSGVFILFFLLGMVRPVSGVMLLPLAMAVSYSTARSKSLLLLLAAVATTAIILAYGITVYISGGLDVYLSATDRVMGTAFRESSIVGGAPLSAHLLMLKRLFGWWLLWAIPMGLIVLIVALKKPGNLNFRRHSSALIIGGAWMLPALAFYSVIYYLKPTYQLIYLPCMLIPLAWVLFGKDSIFKQSSAKLILSGLVIVQLGIFFLPIPNIPEPIRRLTHAYFIQQDHAWEQLIRELDALPKKNTLLIWAEHPSLHMYAAKLLNREGIIAAVNWNRTGLNYFDPKKGLWLSGSGADKGSSIWSTSDTSSEMIGEKYDGVIIIDVLSGKAVVKYIPLANRQHRKIDYLLNPTLLSE